jgi:hypothetical protein
MFPSERNSFLSADNCSGGLEANVGASDLTWAGGSRVVVDLVSGRLCLCKVVVLEATVSRMNATYTAPE